MITTLLHSKTEFLGHLPKADFQLPMQRKNCVQMYDPKLYKETTDTGVSQENRIVQIECGKTLRASGYG